MRFMFPRVDMPYESYDGVLGSVRYFLRVTVSKGGYSGGTVVKELDFMAQNVEVRGALRLQGSPTYM